MSTYMVSIVERGNVAGLDHDYYEWRETLNENSRKEKELCEEGYTIALRLLKAIVKLDPQSSGPVLDRTIVLSKVDPNLRQEVCEALFGNRGVFDETIQITLSDYKVEEKCRDYSGKDRYTATVVVKNLDNFKEDKIFEFGCLTSHGNDEGEVEGELVVHEWSSIGVIRDFSKAHEGFLAKRSGLELSETFNSVLLGFLLSLSVPPQVEL